MKFHIGTAVSIGLLLIAPPLYSDAITDTYEDGDTLTASTLDNIKSAVNDNDARITTLEASGTTYTRIESPSISVPAGGDNFVDVICPSGIAISGGFDSATNAFRVRDNGPNSTLTAWRVQLFNTSATSKSFVASVVCAN